MVAIFGSNGNMGRRYAAVCNYLDIPHIDYDVDYDYSQPLGSEITEVVIATPIVSHFAIASYCVEAQRDFLCEKPISKSVEDVKLLIDMVSDSGVSGFMVNNWKYVLRNPYKSQAVMYNHYTGADGIWDMIQPHHYLTNLQIMPSPIYEVMEYIDVAGSKVDLCVHTRKDFDYSYISMIRDFVNGNYENLMCLHEALEATQKIQSLIDSGKNVY